MQRRQQASDHPAERVEAPAPAPGMAASYSGRQRSTPGLERRDIYNSLLQTRGQSALMRCWSPPPMVGRMQRLQGTAQCAVRKVRHVSRIIRDSSCFVDTWLGSIPCGRRPDSPAATPRRNLDRRAFRERAQDSLKPGSKGYRRQRPPALPRTKFKGLGTCRQDSGCSLRRRIRRDQRNPIQACRP